MRRKNVPRPNVQDEQQANPFFCLHDSTDCRRRQSHGPMLGAVRQTKEGSVMPEEKEGLPPLPPGHEDV